MAHDKRMRINPHSAVKFHKGYAYDKVRHTVLTIAQLSDDMKDSIQAALKAITTGAEAKTMPLQPGWSCSVLDMRGRVLALSYHGIEVALFFQRQLTEIEPQPGQRIPEGVLQDPQEAWMRLDIFGPSAKRANIVMKHMFEQQKEEIKLKNERIETLEQLVDSVAGQQKAEITKLEIALDKAQTTIGVLKDRIREMNRVPDRPKKKKKATVKVKSKKAVPKKRAKR